MLVNNWGGRTQVNNSYTPISINPEKLTECMEKYFNPDNVQMILTDMVTGESQVLQDINQIVDMSGLELLIFEPGHLKVGIRYFKGRYRHPFTRARGAVSTIMVESKNGLDEYEVSRGFDLAVRDYSNKTNSNSFYFRF